MKKKYIGVLIAVMCMAGLASCGKADATFVDATADSLYGKLSNFSGASKEGDTLTFTVTPSQYFYIKSITNNNKPCTRVRKNTDGSYVYSTVLSAGENTLRGAYSVDANVDFVDEFKLDITDEVFNEIMNKEEASTGDATKLDFRKSGVEQVRAPNKWVNNVKTSRLSDKNYFINFVDGDTTHVETYNLDYTVKIRYLGIDTPESTSEIEEWGLTASYYSKYIYSGDEQYKNKISKTTDFTNVKAGATSIILMSQAFADASAYATVDSLAIGTTEQGPLHSETDGNQRDLAFVWYSTVQNPTKNDFRCLNLEMVYQGFSPNNCSSGKANDEYYRMFDAANLSAIANGRHAYGDDDDNNYFDWKTKTAAPLTLEQLYEDSSSDPDIGYKQDSAYCNNRSLYKIEGYVTRKVGTSFYMQSKPSYTQEEIDNKKCYGIYVFTYSQTPIMKGYHVTVIGALSSYGGTYQIQGISYHDEPDLRRDTTFEVDEFNDPVVYDIQPVKLTGAQFNSYKLPSVLVEITDNLWFYNFSSVYQGATEPIGEGGSEEVNKYNTAYPFYNTSNSPIFYASFGDTDNAEQVQSEAGTSGPRYSNSVIRFNIDQNVLVKYKASTCYSYRFFTGGEYNYNPKGAQYANFDDDNPYKDQTITKTFNRKVVYGTGVADHGLIVISHGYESTGGNKKMSATICSGATSDIIVKEVTAE